MADAAETTTTETKSRLKPKPKPRSTFGWFPKLILWGVVITFGYLYLSSLDQQDGKLSESLLAKINEISPIPITALPGMEPKSPPATEMPAVAPAPIEKTPAAETFTHKTVEVAKPAIAPAPAPVAHSVNAAESAGVASSAINKETAPAPPVAAPAKTPVIVQQQTPVAVTPPSVPSAPASLASAPQMVAPAPVNQMPLPRTQPYDWEAMARQQAMMQAQYAAMRRDADARMRQYWERMQSAPPTPDVMPYGYPGYPAGYLPGSPQR